MKLQSQQSIRLKNMLAFVAACLLTAPLAASAAQSRISIQSPAGGENFIEGQQQVVRVTSRLKSVTVELSRDGGQTFEAMGTIDALSKDLNKRNALTWTVTLPASATCIVRVSSGAFSATSGMFSIAPKNSASQPPNIGTPGANSVTTAALADGSVTTPKLADNAVTSLKISSGQSSPNFVLTADGNGGSYWQPASGSGAPTGNAGGDLAGTYPNPQIGSGVVSTVKLAANAVTTGKIADSSVTTPKINSGAALINTVLAADGLGGATWQPLTGGGGATGNAGGDLAGSYPSPTIAAGVVSTAKLANAAVTDAKINDVAWGKLTSVPNNVSNAVENKGSAPSLQSGVDASLPSPGTTGRLYVATDTLKLYRDNGTAWDLVTPALTGDVTVAAGATSTSIAANAVTTAKIADGNVTAAKLAANSVDLTGAAVTGVLPIAAGGTGQNSASGAFNALAPSQTVNSGKFLSTNGTTTSWVSAVVAPAGADTQVQFNDNGAFGADTSFSYDKTAKALTLAGTGAPALNLPGSPAANGTSALLQLGAPVVGGSGSGTYFGLNGPVGYTGNLADFQVGDVSMFSLDSGGTASLRGNINFTSAESVISSPTGLTLQETGDVYGPVRLRLQNRNNVNGAMFEQAGSVDLVDFVFKGLNNQRNIRYENRNNAIFVAAPEFEFGAAADPTFVVADQQSSFRKGNVGIGTTNPTSKLTVNDQGGGAILAQFQSGDGNVNIQDISGAFYEGDSGVFFDYPGSGKSALYTEYGGVSMALGMNCPEIMSNRDQNRSGAVLRLNGTDTLSQGNPDEILGHAFYLKRYPRGSNTAVNDFTVNLDNGDTYLAPNGGKVGVGTTNPTTPFSVVAQSPGTLTNVTDHSTGAQFVVNTDAYGRCAVGAIGSAVGTGQGGGYFTASGYEESWYNLYTGSNSANLKFMRFGNLNDKFSIQRLTDDSSSIQSTPFSVKNDAPTDSFTVNSAGQIGLGTNAPSYALELGGTDATIHMNSANSNMLRFNTNGVAPPSTTGRSSGTKVVLFPQGDGNASGDYAIGIEGYHTWFSIPLATNLYGFKFYAGTSELMNIQGTGEVGIGTSTPVKRLSVVDDTANGVVAIQNNNLAGWADVGFYDSTGTQMASLGYGNPNAGVLTDLCYFGSAAHKDLMLYTNGYTNERMRVTADGAVGMGTSAPAANVRLALKDGHVQVQQSTAPTANAESGAGTGASASVSNATDAAGNAALTTGSASYAAGAQLTVTFNQAYNTPPIVTLTPTNANAANGARQVYVVPTTTGFTINFGSADSAATNYSWSYQVIETQ